MRSKVNKNNRGFTLIELLVAVAIISVVSGGLGMTVNTIFKTYQIARDEAVALRQVQNAGLWLTRDIQRVANSPNLNGFPILIECYTGDDSTSTETITYGINTEISTNHKMFRSVGDEQLLIAEYLDSNNTTITTNTDDITGDKYYTLYITASYGGKSKSGSYIIRPRIQ